MKNPIMHIRDIRNSAVSIVALVLALGACNAINDALKVDAPATIPADGIAVPANAELLTDGAIGDFECAFGAYVALTAEISHEMEDATETADRWPYYKRNVHSDDARYGQDDCINLGVYTPVSTARWSADNILGYLQQWTDQQVSDRQTMIAEAAAYGGYSYVLLGEGFCQAAIDLSPALSSAAMFDSAVVRFSAALTAAQAAGVDSLKYLALVGRARAYLDLSQGANAAADAQQVPADFVYNMSASNAVPRRQNRVFAQNGYVSSTNKHDAMSVDSTYRDAMDMGQPDPRVPVLDGGYVQTIGVPIFFQQKYTDYSSPIPIASGVEALLIRAEVQGGTTADSIINYLHGLVGLPTNYSQTDPDSIAAQVQLERDHALWLTGHRFYDIRRLSLPLVPAPGAPAPAGFGGTFGSTVCFPLPDVEVNNNPNIG
jgi:starch-binding outer membrane protein, SusD/RagB family